MDGIISDLAAVEELLKQEPDNADLLDLHRDLREMLSMHERLQTIQGNEPDDMFTADNEVGEQLATAENVLPADTIDPVSAPRSDQASNGDDGGGNPDPLNLSTTPVASQLDRPVAFTKALKVLMPTADGYRDESSVESSDSEEESLGGSNESEDFASSSSEPTNADDPAFQHIGEWEKHTKGIGLKLLRKYGFKKGQGLGNRGLSEPITLDEQTGSSKHGLGHFKRKHVERDNKGRERSTLRKKRKFDARPGETATSKKRKTGSESQLFEVINKTSNQPFAVEEFRKTNLRGLGKEELQKVQKENEKELGELLIRRQKLQLMHERNNVASSDVAKQLENAERRIEQLQSERLELKARVDIKAKGRTKLKSVF
jgi:hypothetical protein